MLVFGQNHRVRICYFGNEMNIPFVILSTILIPLNICVGPVKMMTHTDFDEATFIGRLSFNCHIGVIVQSGAHCRCSSGSVRAAFD